MFGKKVEKPIDIDSLISENIKITGKIEGKGSLRIDGIVEGDIDYKGDINIGESGNINGNITCNNVSLAGRIDGNVKSNAKLVILPTGKLNGDVEVASFIVHEDAFFEGSCKMLNKEDKVRDLQAKKSKNTK